MRKVVLCKNRLCHFSIFYLNQTYENTNAFVIWFLVCFRLFIILSLSQIISFFEFKFYFWCVRAIVVCHFVSQTCSQINGFLWECFFWLKCLKRLGKKNKSWKQEKKRKLKNSESKIAYIHNWFIFACNSCTKFDFLINSTNFCMLCSCYIYFTKSYYIVCWNYAFFKL